MKSFLFSSLLVLSLSALAADKSALCKKSNSSHQISFAQSIQPRATDEITVITWNAHKFDDKKFFHDLKRLSQSSDILMVQEALHSEKWQMAFESHFSMSFSFFKSFCRDNDQATGVMTAARGLLESNQTLISTGVEPIISTPKVTGYSMVQINGQVVHLLNTHALNFNTGMAFEDQMDQVTNFIAGLSGPVIWAGDFNTWSASRLAYLNNKVQSVGLQHLKPIVDNRRLMLDHIYVRGLSAQKTEVLTEKTSDHFPVRTILKFN